MRNRIEGPEVLPRIEREPALMPALAFYNIGHVTGENWTDLQRLVATMMTPTGEVVDILVPRLPEFANTTKIAAIAEEVSWQIPDFALVGVMCDPALAWSIIRRLRERGLRVVVPVTGEGGSFKTFREVE